MLILKTDGQKLLYFRSGSQTPETLSVEEASAQFEPELILVARKAEGARPDAEIPSFQTEKKAFGFRWFIPELLKHKKIWRDVLLASLAIRLVGLVTPLFTQVIIDKVVVHQTHNTLIVLGVALIMFMLFTGTMTWLRQYLVLHTGNRIDAVLGSQVFRHLLRLPLPYFEQRPTGTLVMAHPHAGFEDVIQACKAAEIHDVIEQLPDGYQTEIGERGTGLSGGQKQRLAIARALLKQAKILIFDEAVSNLDSQTAEHFARTINKLKGKVTLLFITHQIPRGLQVDEVIELEGKCGAADGGVVDEG